MKKFLMLMIGFLSIVSCLACSNEAADIDLNRPDKGVTDNDGELFDGKRTLVAYISWGGTTRRLAE